MIIYSVEIRNNITAALTLRVIAAVIVYRFFQLYIFSGFSNKLLWYYIPCSKT